DEHGFELLRDLAHRFLRICAAFQLQRAEARQVGVDLRGRGGSACQEVAHVRFRNQITISCARSAPTCCKASRIATRSLGDAPTWFTARTSSSSDTPGWNRNMRLSSSSIV